MLAAVTRTAILCPLGALNDAAICPSFLLSVCPSACLSRAASSTMMHLSLWSLQNTNRKPQVGSQPTSQRGHTATGSGRNVSEAVASEAFARWLHHQHTAVELQLARGILFRHAISSHSPLCCCSWIDLTAPSLELAMSVVSERTSWNLCARAHCCFSAKEN